MNSFRGIALSAALGLIASSAAQATYVIDNFSTVSSTITQNGNGTTTSAAASGVGILGLRSIALTVTSPLTSASADVGLTPGFAQASFNGPNNPVNLATNFTLSESFASTNAVTDGDTAVTFTLASSAGVTVTITANGTSTATLTLPSSGLGATQSFSFASFSDPTVFTHLTSLVFKETFPNAALSGPSVAFTGPILLNNPGTVVPEPAAIVMIAQAGLAFGLFGTGRRFVRRRRALC